MNLHDPLQQERAQRLDQYLSGLPPASAETMDRCLGGFAESADPLSFVTSRTAAWIAELYGVNDAKRVEIVDFATYLSVFHAILQDRRMDGDHRGELASRTDVLCNILLADSLHLFGQITADPGFGDFVHQVYADLAAAYECEPNYIAMYAQNPASLFRPVVDRSAPWLLPIAALGFHTGRTTGIGPLCDAYRHFTFGLQIHDDLSDWREDLERGKASLLLALLSPRIDSQFGDWKTDEVANALYLYGGLEEALRLSSNHLTRCRDTIQQIARGGLLDMIRSQLDENERIASESIARKKAFLRAI
jgi:hypothetical protein